MEVNEIMSSEIYSCSANTTLDIVARMMWENNCGAIPVVDNSNKPVGMVTDRDIAMCCAINHKAPWELTASIINGKRKIYACNAQDNVENVLIIMKKQKVRRLPVIDEDGCLLAMLSISNIISHSQKSKSKKSITFDLTMPMLKAMTITH